jgi:hypothetical protein
VKVEFMRCDCPGRDVGGGHMARWCLLCGWYAAPGHDLAGWFIRLGSWKAED